MGFFGFRVSRVLGLMAAEWQEALGLVGVFRFSRACVLLGFFLLGS